MAKDQPLSTTETETEEEEYIEMELTTSSNFVSCPLLSPPPLPPQKAREFEFEMASPLISREQEERMASPADELFYKGQLLPLHLSPRLQMVKNLLQTSIKTTHEHKPEEENIIHTPFITVSSTIPTDDKDTAFREKLKEMKKSYLGQKVKASRTYFKSLFSKSACSDEQAEAATKRLDKCVKVAKKKPFGSIDYDSHQISGKLIGKKDMAKEEFRYKRKSFSGAIQRASPTKSSTSSNSSSGSSSLSSSFSFSSTRFYDLDILVKSSSRDEDSEKESSIQEAIAHCKQCRQFSSLRKTATDKI